MPENSISLTWPAEGLTRVPCRIYHDPEVYARKGAARFREKLVLTDSTRVDMLIAAPI